LSAVNKFFLPTHEINKAGARIYIAPKRSNYRNLHGKKKQKIFTNITSAKTAKPATNTFLMYCQK